LVSLLAAGLTKIRVVRREREARAFLLRMLTHELRTPATTIGLSLENLRRDFDSLPERAQGEFLRLCDSVQRLRRVVEASSAYLRADFAFQPSDIRSINQFVGGQLRAYEGRLEFVPLDEDRSLRLDPYWVGLCLHNLVGNALKHGKPPVTVRLASRRHVLELTVEDGGSLQNQRGGDGEGLGPGLSIVDKVARLMQGRLMVRPSPTAFTLWLRETT
jgi:signal transduction histidine kinase